MKIRLGGAVVVLLLLGLGRAHAGPVCTGESACQQSCDGGKALACRELGRMHAAGDGVAPDHAAAVKAWTRGCDGKTNGKDKDDPANDAGRDARSCLELARQLHDGWTLEVVQDTYGAADRLTQAISLAGPICDKGGGDACFTIALATRDQLEAGGWPLVDTERATDLVKKATTACQDEVLPACMYLRKNLWELVNHELFGSADVTVARNAADKQLGEMCKNGDALACLDAQAVMRDDKARKVIITKMHDACADGQPAACLAEAFVKSAEIPEPDEADKVDDIKAIIGIAFDACDSLIHDACPDIAISLATKGGDFEEFGIEADPTRALKMLRNQCAHGLREACDAAGKLLLDGASGVTQDLDDGRRLHDRGCQLTKPSVKLPDAPGGCQICSTLGDLPECTRRDSWQISTACGEGNLESCELLGDRYTEGIGVAISAPDSARSFKYACDGSIKSACGKLDDVCHANDTIGEELCAPSLLHTDVFYEAEWQLRVNQTATLSKGTATAAGDATSVTVASDAAGGGGISMRRGKLDADLVVSVVLDRARQAAARLLSEELRDKMGARGIRTYMRDLLEQGASLMADPTSLRRDALQDLGMTLVRAFAASNLVRTTLGDATAVRASPVIGDVVKDWKTAWLTGKDGRLARDLEAYLADAAYWALGTESLFARAGAGSDPAPACPFVDARKDVCAALSTRDKVIEALRIDGVLTALNMVRALGSEGGFDVRRLIEAIAQSRSIVDFVSTPGLNLTAWKTRIVDDLRDKVAILSGGLGALTRVLERSTYEVTGPDVITLAAQLVEVRAFVTGDGAVLLGSELAGELGPLLKVALLAPQGLGAAATPELNAKAREQANAALDDLRKDWRDALAKKQKAAQKKIDGVIAQLDELGRHITGVRTSLEHHQPAGVDVHLHLKIDDIPLGDLDELLLVFPKVVGVFDALDAGARELIPGIDLRGLRFARSSVVRLLGFLDLMSRVARSVRLTQTIRQVIDTLELLGRWSEGEFSAPLYDMLQPVLDLIETRTPMPLEQLFAIIGRVRLDSLVTSLMSDSPCANEDRAECWVFKIAYSLQEAISRDGDSIRIDGAEVAKRLAKFGDDFRRRTKGRWYFHLTVGIGSMFSPAPPDPTDAEGDIRFTPIIAEQVGFGYASPAVWKDRLTFKFGLAASGILYRMLLDNEESNAVMGMAFVAMDVYDLIEVYAAANVLAYPPGDMTDARVEPGISFGLSVPLSAYLDKL